MVEASRAPGGLGMAARVVVLLVATRATGAGEGTSPPASHVAEKLLQKGGVPGGLVVHIGSGDAALTARLHAGGKYLVHGLEHDRDAVERARHRLRELGLYGQVSVDFLDRGRLPYVRGMVNLLVAEDLGGVPREEALRVLSPGGVLLLKRGEEWEKIVKPRPDATDEWTHYLHDASGNAVSRDRAVGPPRHVQWIAGPRHARSHEHTPSINTLVSSGGRIFYIADVAPTRSLLETPEWHLVAKDGYNGLSLWSRSFRPWFPHLVNWGQVPSQLQRRLVATGGRVYVTLGLHSPVSALDAATGEDIRTYDGTRGAEEIVVHRGVLLVVVREVSSERIAELAKWEKLWRQKDSPVLRRESAQPLVQRLRAVELGGERSLVALDAASGRILWRRDGADVAGLRALTLSASDGRVFFQSRSDVWCLDLSSGQEVWSVAATPFRVVSGGKVICANGRRVEARSTETGARLWERATLLSELRDTFIIGDSVWLGGFKPYQGRSSGKRGPSWGPYFVTQLDLSSGGVVRHVEPENPGHHHRCWRNKATERFILGGRRGVEFIDLKTGDVLWNSWVRGVCRYGVMPSNGLLYAPPHACGCYVAAKLTGFCALAPERASEAPGAPADEGRLERGPAYAAPRSSGRSVSVRLEWPTYRGGPERSGATGARVGPAVRVGWRAEIGGRITAPTVGAGRVLVGRPDAHEVVALDADSGEVAWRFGTGARVDSPPTLHEGRAIFGCRDGFVYSVRLSDGKLAWRLRAARLDRRIVAFGQLESVWPVHGSVLVREGVVLFVSGRSSYVDGGMDLWRVDAASGKAISTTPIYSPDPETGRQPPHDGPGNMPGALEAILAADDNHVYLREMVFDTRGAERAEGRPHLLAVTGFLDDSWAHRTYWIYGTRCSLATGCTGRDRNIVSGRLLVLDDSMVYGFGRGAVHWSNQFEDGPYRVFAARRDDRKTEWSRPLSIEARAMVLADRLLFLGGVAWSDERVGTQNDQATRDEARIIAVSAADGSVAASHPLASSPVLDGMAATAGRLVLSLENGCVVSMESRQLGEQ